MTGLTIRPADECRYDLVALGEIMLRLDPGEGRIRTARQFQAWEGGGEYNVARGLRRCFGLRTAVVTAFADNEVGRLLEDFVLQGGVDTSLIRWMPVGRHRAHGPQRPQLHRARLRRPRRARRLRPRPHRGLPAAAGRCRLGPPLRRRSGVRWFHTGGIFAALSDTTPEVVVEAVAAAKRHGTVVSYDLNYRPSLWKGDRRRRAGARGEPPDRGARRRDDRQRGGLHRLPRPRGRGRRREPHRARHRLASGR